MRRESNVEASQDFGGLVLACSLLAVLLSGAERRRVIQGKVVELSMRQQWPARKATRISSQLPARMRVAIGPELRNGNADKARPDKPTDASMHRLVSSLITHDRPAPATSVKAPIPSS